MRVILHGRTDDVSHLVEAAIVHFVQRVHNAPLNGFQTVFDRRNGTFQNYIRGIIKKPVFV